MYETLRGYVTIVRPINVVLSFIAVYLVMLVSNGLEVPGMQMAAFYAALSASLGCAGSNVINDYFDVEIDKINRPDRAIAKGLISKRQALIYWSIINIGALAMSAMISFPCFLIALFSVFALVFYSSHLKGTPLFGNLTVSFFMALAFIYGGLAIGRWKAAVVPALFAFLFHLGREILKDIEDIEGDRSQSAKTFPIVYGIRTSLYVASVAFVLLIAVTLLAYTMGIYDSVYLWIMVTAMYPALIYTLYSMWRDVGKANLRKLNTLLKIEMFVGLFAIYFG
jgi:geranylgeranylglycerol-phosphate geranylgeranyltransferase